MCGDSLFQIVTVSSSMFDGHVKTSSLNKSKREEEEATYYVCKFLSCTPLSWEILGIDLIVD